jgi:hypothetical protein
VERECSAALARAAEIQKSGGFGTIGDLPGQLARLCAVLTGPGDLPGQADGLPFGWSSVIDGAGRTDGAERHREQETLEFQLP